MNRLPLALALVSLGCAASPAPEPTAPDAPVASPPSTQPAAPSAGPSCPPDAFVADGACYETSDGACLALGCSDCQILESAPAQVRCAQ